ncbi:MAG: kinase, partial [Deltaproteobacteria bacterium]|nr:kinase [Deltaproteobacteria bacterium]
MIITRTPYRVSFFGGGTDFPQYYEEHGGSVISCTINRYSYLQCRILPPFFDHRYRIRYFQTERTRSIDEIEHPSVRECLRFLNYQHPLEVLHSGDIPAMSGIGSSSSFTVGFLLALHGLMGKMITKRELAQQAIEVEQQWIQEHVGSQDQYAAAFGGFNRIDFGLGKQIRLTPLMLKPEKLQHLQDNRRF